MIYSNDDSTEMLFEKIKDREIIEQVRFAALLANPKRKQLFGMIYDAVTDEYVKQNISLTAQRIEQAAFQVSGYTSSEIEHYQSVFAKYFYDKLYSDDYQTDIEDTIRELHFYIKALEQDLKTIQYEYLEEREKNKFRVTEAERYKGYLENLLIHLNTAPPQQNETKTDKLKSEIGKYGFFELPDVKQLSDLNKQRP
jgi:hypothetical protein